MSTAFGLYCVNCDEDSNYETFGAREGVPFMLKELAKDIRDLVLRDLTGYLEISVMAYGDSLPQFVIAHADHELIVCDEYGYEYNDVTHKRELL